MEDWFMFRLATVDVLSLNTPEEVRQAAARLKGLGGTESEREDKSSRKNNIRAKVLNREATPFRWCVGRVLDTGLRRRVNGQHGSEVFLELTPEEWGRVAFPVVVVWEEYDCDTMRDLPVLFEQFDPSWSTRNGEDYMGAHLGIHSDMYRLISRTVALKVAQGIVWWRTAVDGQKLGRGARYEVVHEDGPDADTRTFLLWCGSFLQKGKTEEMHHPFVLGAIYHTAREDEAVRKFWCRVAAGKVTLDADTIEYKLAEFLDKFRDKQSTWPAAELRWGRNQPDRSRPSDLDVFTTCLRAVRAWQAGTKVAGILTLAKGKKASEIAASFSPRRGAA
jgi:hypothetical protein